MEPVYDYPTVPQPRVQASEQAPEYMEIAPEPSTSGKVSKKCEELQNNIKWAPFIVLIVIQCATVLLLLTVLLLIATKYTINKNSSSNDAEIYVAQQLNAHFAQNRSSKNLIQKMRENTKKVRNISDSEFLSSLNSTSTSTADTINNVLAIVKELLLIYNQSSGPNISCQDIKNMQPNNPSGYYIINGTEIYCHMGQLCGSDTWARLAYLNMNDSMEKCPSGFKLWQSGAVRACGRPVTDDGSCVSVKFSSNGIRYSQICGRVVGYQYATTDGLRSLEVSPNRYNINNSYVDGVSITRGSSRQHVWTFASGSSDTEFDRESRDTCLCSGSFPLQTFIGSHYFCESGNHRSSEDVRSSLHTSDPLWDGKGCGSNEGQCCSASGLPWFHRDYGNSTTTDYIELRVCCNQGTRNEDVPVEFYEIYVK
uniref:Uncharacterized protein n=1 Tax=Amphimedon queenslandica TaxID=400682 RepID=A0A1X7U216_AMPQE